jgi:hypothetical protein
MDQITQIMQNTKNNENPISLKSINQPESMWGKLENTWCITMNPQNGNYNGGTDKTEDNSLENDNFNKDVPILFYISIEPVLISHLYKRINKIFKENIENEKITITSFINRICEDGLKYFNSSSKITLLEGIVKEKETTLYKIIPRFFVNQKYNTEDFKKVSNFTQYNVFPSISHTGYVYNKLLSGHKKKQNIVNMFNVFGDIFNLCTREIRGIGNITEPNQSINQSSGWTDTTLTRIEKIKDVLDGYSSGMIYLPKNKNQLLSAGWTDTTLTRIEKIKDVLDGYSTGKINSSLLKVMSKTKQSSGWTDTTLTRIEKINNVLKNVI